MIDPKITNWVKDSLNKGFSKESIADQLIRKGFSLEQINEAFKVVQPELSKKADSVASNKLRILTFAALIILVAGSLFFFTLSRGRIEFWKVSYNAGDNKSLESDLIEKKYSNEDILKIIRRDIVPTIVQVRCYDGVSDYATKGGTGFYYSNGKNYFVDTNAHVVLADDGKFYGCEIYFPFDNGEFYKSVYLSTKAWVYHNKESIVDGKTIKGIDYAVLNITDPYKVYGSEENSSNNSYPLPPTDKDFFKSINKTCIPDTIQLGDKVYVLGYPAVGKESLTITEGIVSGFLGDENQWIKISATINPGNSGGVAISSDNGCMFGIPTLISSDIGGGIGRLLSYSYIADFVDGLTGKELDIEPYEQLNKSFAMYENAQLGVKLFYPDDWAFDNATLGELIMFVSPVEHELDQQEALTLDVYDASSSDTTLEGFKNSYLEKLADPYLKSNLTLVEKTTLGKEPAYKFVFTRKLGTTDFQYTQYIAMHNSRFYLLMFSSRASESFKFDSLLDTIIGWFEFK